MISAVLIGTAGLLQAQSISFISLSKSIDYVQTDGSTVIVDPQPVSADYGGPYGFQANVEGDREGPSIGGITAPVLSGPITVLESTPGYPDSTFFNGGTLVFNAEDNEWGFGYPLGNDWGAQSQAAIDNVFGSGTYSFTVNGTQLDMSLSPVDYPNTPQFTFTGSEWVNGRYYIDYNTELTITTNTFTGYGTHTEDAVWMSVWSEDGSYNSGDGQPNLASMNPTGNFMTLTIPAGTLTAGSRYEVEAGFFAGTYFEADNANFPGAMIVAGHEKSVRVELVATPIPDPGPITAAISPAVAVRFSTQQGFIYKLEASGDLENWIDVMNDIHGDGTEMTFYFDVWGGSQHYRAVRTFP